MPVPQAKRGLPVTIKGRKVPFSYWPMYRSNRRYGLQVHVYASNPWAIVERSVRRECGAQQREEALACLDQARYFYRGSVEAAEWAAKPRWSRAGRLARAHASPADVGHRQASTELLPGESRVEFVLRCAQGAGMGIVLGDGLLAERRGAGGRNPCLLL